MRMGSIIPRNEFVPDSDYLEPDFSFVHQENYLINCGNVIHTAFGYRVYANHFSESRHSRVKCYIDIGARGESKSKQHAWEGVYTDLKTQI